MVSIVIPKRTWPTDANICTIGSDSIAPLVLEESNLNLTKPLEDRIRAGSRRSKPNSRTLLRGEQPHPWCLLQHLDKMSRHRGAKRACQCELSGLISLLSLE